VSGLVQIRTAVLVLAEIQQRRTYSGILRHLTLPKRQAPALYPRRTKNRYKCVQMCD
jgi:hypothetical protein